MSRVPTCRRVMSSSVTWPMEPEWAAHIARPVLSVFSLPWQHSASSHPHRALLLLSALNIPPTLCTHPTHPSGLSLSLDPQGSQVRFVITGPYQHLTTLGTLVSVTILHLFMQSRLVPTCLSDSTSLILDLLTIEHLVLSTGGCSRNICEMYEWMNAWVARTSVYHLQSVHDALVNCASAGGEGLRTLCLSLVISSR